MIKKNKLISKVLLFLDDIIYYAILIPLMITTVFVVYKSIAYPEKIPDVFGYKMFIVLDNNMHNSVESGDLIFTKNIEINELQKGDIIAARPNGRYIALYSVLEIEDSSVVKTADNNRIKKESLEGKIINRIAKIGLVLYYIQQPLVLAVIIIFILIIGLIVYYIAQQLDFRDMKRLEELEKEKN